MLPKGIRLLRGPKRSESYTGGQLIKCCDSYQWKCEHMEECHRLFDVRCGEWKLHKQAAESPYQRTPPDIERYSDYLPTLDLINLLPISRERPIC